MTTMADAEKTHAPAVASEEGFLKAFFSSLDEAAITYVVLRNYESLPESLGGSDLDLLVGGADLETFYRVLEEVIQAQDADIIAFYGHLTPRACILHRDGAFGLQLDIHEGILPYRVFPTLDAEAILARGTTHNGIHVAGEHDAAIIALLKEILNNQVCDESYFAEAKAAYAAEPTHYHAELSKAFGKAFVDQFREMANGDYCRPTLRRLARLGRRMLTRGLRPRLKSVVAQAKKARRFLHPPGFSIAVLGCDGSGKSTLIDRMAPPLRDAVHNALYYEHMRPNLIPGIAQLLGRPKPDGPVTDPQGRPPAGLAGSLLRLAYYTCDYVAGWWWKVYPRMARKSCIWIFDRYYYDYLIDPRRARVRLPRWVIRAVAVLIPSPDLILCLGTAPERIHARKPELRLDEVRRQVAELSDFCRTRENAVWIDTGDAIEASVVAATRAVAKHMGSRPRHALEIMHDRTTT